MAQRAGVSFELERLDLEGDELVVTGHWSGVRGLRFVRPALVVDDRRILASLEHKPWAPSLDRTWIAAFPWDRDDVDVGRLKLAVGSQVTVPLDDAPSAAIKSDASPAVLESGSGREPAPVTPIRARASQRPEPEPESRPAAAAPAAASATATAAAPAPVPVAAPDAVAQLEAELDAVRCERDALVRRLEESERLAREREQRASDESAALDELARARTTAERDRDRALAQLAEAVAAREAAVRARSRMEIAHDEALKVRESAEAALATAQAQREEANSQRDEVLLAYRALQRHVRSERADEDRAQGSKPAAQGNKPAAQGNKPDGPEAETDDEEPIGVRKMPAARTVMAELQRPTKPAGKLPFSVFDLWVIRVLGSVAAACFILLLISILRLFV